MPTDPKVRGARLRAMREAAGLSQTELGARIGVGRSHIGRVEKGEHGLTLARLDAWVEACGGNPSEVSSGRPSVVVTDDPNRVLTGIEEEVLSLMARISADRHDLFLQFGRLLVRSSERAVIYFRGIMAAAWEFDEVDRASADGEAATDQIERDV